MVYRLGQKKKKNFMTQSDYSQKLQYWTMIESSMHRLSSLECSKYAQSLMFGINPNGTITRITAYSIKKFYHYSLNLLYY